MNVSEVACYLICLAWLVLFGWFLLMMYFGVVILSAVLIIGIPLSIKMLKNKEAMFVLGFGPLYSLPYSKFQTARGLVEFREELKISDASILSSSLQPAPLVEFGKEWRTPEEIKQIKEERKRQEEERKQQELLEKKLEQKRQEAAREKQMEINNLLSEGYTTVCRNCMHAYHKRSKESWKCPKCGSLDVVND